MSSEKRDRLALALAEVYDEAGVAAYFREHKQAAEALYPVIAATAAALAEAEARGFERGRRAALAERAS